jgi:hypothetical protein
MEGAHHRKTGTDSTGRTTRGKEQTQRRLLQYQQRTFSFACKVNEPTHFSSAGNDPDRTATPSSSAATPSAQP